MIFNERYTAIWYGSEEIGPALFETERVFDIRETDSHASQNNLVKRQQSLKRKLLHANIVGDKAPRLHRRIDEIREAFPGAKFVYVVRNIYDVASSYEQRADAARNWSERRRTQAAVSEWNESLSNIMSKIDEDVFVVCYEDFFNKKRGLGHLAGFLRDDGVALDEGQVFENAKALEEERRPFVPSDGRMAIAKTADFNLYRKVLRRWNRQLRVGAKKSRSEDRGEITPDLAEDQSGAAGPG